MVIDIPTKAGKVPDLKQRDVRETTGITGKPTIGDFTSAQHSHAAAGATGGTVDHANLTSIGTNSHAQIDTHIGNTANPHSVILTDLASPGEGIDFSGTDIKGENASTTNKGIAAFHTDDFTTAVGVINLKADVCKTIDGDSGTATAAVHNIDILGGAGIDTAASGNDVTISGEDATSANKGIASFSATDFAVSSGAVSLKSKASAWSCNGTAFHPLEPDVDDVDYILNEGDLSINAAVHENVVQASVNLPKSAVVTGVVVYGSDTGEEWTLWRANINAASNSTLMATANIGTEDTSISDATIANSVYCYFLEATVGAGDVIYGARILYATDYI